MRHEARALMRDPISFWTPTGPKGSKSNGIILRIRRSAIAVGTLALAVPAAKAQTSTWISDPAHSEVSFSATHLTVSNVHGFFNRVAATGVYDRSNVTKSSVSATL